MLNINNVQILYHLFACIMADIIIVRFLLSGELWCKFLIVTYYLSYFFLIFLILAKVDVFCFCIFYYTVCPKKWPHFFYFFE